MMDMTNPVVVAILLAVLALVLAGAFILIRVLGGRAVERERSAPPSSASSAEGPRTPTGG